ncbi:MAG: MBL fold metallo-hydrolase [Desulfobacteraceae bacterium]|nr:MBL fold metallo-hydrolase [Desulfobacteraceae bacterium]
MIIKGMPVGPLQANCYIVGCEQTKQAAVIDPGGDTDRILLALSENQLKVEVILNTHGHFDHVAGNKSLKNATGADLMIHELDVSMLDMLSGSAAAWGLQAENSPKPDRLLADGDTVKFGQITFKVIHTPGHSPGSTSFYADQAVFVGDTLFEGSIGRTDLPGGNFNTLMDSLKNKLFGLPDDTTVYTGHMGSTTIGHEKRTNPFCTDF